MSLIVAARFETFEAAEQAAASMIEQGIRQEAIQVFFVNRTGPLDPHPKGHPHPEAVQAEYGAVKGAAVIGIVGALIGVAITYTLTDSLLPIVGGAGVGAYVGSLAGALYIMGRAKARQPGERPPAKERTSGVVLAVNAAPEAEQKIVRMLRAAGGVEVERAQGQWVDGRWEDFNPLAEPELELENDLQVERNNLQVER